MKPIVKFKKLVPEATIPKYAKPGDAGMDLSCISGEGITIWAGSRACLSTGLQVEIPPGYEGQIRSRSGWAKNEGIAVLNAPGTLDSGFRGEINVILINHGDRDVTISTGDRIAQLVISPVASAEIVEAEELSTTERGTDGLGSTGLKNLFTKSKVKFCLQPTRSFNAGGPAREEYGSDKQHEDACGVYKGEWLQAYECTGCQYPDCPQHSQNSHDLREVRRQRPDQ